MKLKPLMAATWTALTIGISCVVASPAMAASKQPPKAGKQAGKKKRPRKESNL